MFGTKAKRIKALEADNRSLQTEVEDLDWQLSVAKKNMVMLPRYDKKINKLYSEIIVPPIPRKQDADYLDENYQEVRYQLCETLDIHKCIIYRVLKDSEGVHIQALIEVAHD